ncbi:MAG: type II toxin-antitoxin system death-on-curing family toxin [Chloroflexi bacterium]|nr:type II toxin-antitoxin system death-on-curing family toxin [Chloroflexota bacterium]
MSRLHYLDQRDIHGIVAALTRDLFPDTPAFHLAGREGAALLDSALAQPRLRFHRTAQHKAAALHFSMNKNHAFIDGNKRLAVAAMEWFLYRNRFLLLTTNERLLEFSLQVADGRMSREESARWIESRALRTTWSSERLRKWTSALLDDEYPEVMAATLVALATGGDTTFMRSVKNVLDQV